MDKPYRVVIAEDQTIVRKGLRSLLDGEEMIDVIGEAEDGLEAIRMVGKLQPDLILLDLAMPKMNGIAALTEINRLYPATRVLALTVHSSEEYIQAVFKAGAHGYCLKSDSHTDLFSAMKSIFSGKKYLSPSISDKVLKVYLDSRGRVSEQISSSPLTQREREVLQLIAEGYKSREIGDLLCISPKTVDKHRSNMMKKLGLHSATELTTYALREGISAG